MPSDNILYDFSPIKSGGGVQLALNFIDAIERSAFCGNCFILLPSIGPLRDASFDFLPRDNVFFSPPGALSRLMFEHGKLQRIIKRNDIKKIYTFFGPGLPHSRSVRSVVGVAYPIITYPDSPFWDYVDVKSRIKQKIINYVRIHRLRRATHIIVETDVMKSRLIKTLKINENKFTVIPPSVTDYVNSMSCREKFNGRILCLSGLSQHKNLWRLYEVALQLQSVGIHDIKFILTADMADYLLHLKERNVDRDIIRKYFEFCGSVHPRKISELYESVDVLLNISDLESFSNNYMEAWKAGIPIIASNRDFAKNICGDSAIYVEPHDPVDVANAIAYIRTNDEIRIKLVNIGKAKLLMLPAIEEKIKLVRKVIFSE